MPYKVANYKNGKIYKIEHLEKPELIYIGSTTMFNRRKSSHKRNCNNETNKEYNGKLYNMMRLNGGWDAFKCMIIKEFPCNNKTELLIEEEKHRKEYQATLNKNRAYRTEEEAKEISRQYYETNRDKLIENVKQYNEANKDKITEYSKQYYEVNKDKINKKQKDYYEANIDKINEKHKNYYEANIDKLREKHRQYQKDRRESNKLKNLIIQKEEPNILTGSPTETEDETETDDGETDEPQIIEVLGNGVKFEIQIY
jgi:hypothetical protein